MKLLDINNAPADDAGGDDSVAPSDAQCAPLQATPSALPPSPAVTPPSERGADPPPKKRPRKSITKHMKLESLSAAGENPVLTAVPVADKAYIRASGVAERQIVSVPLLLVNEQLGAAAERFNICTCDVCLRTVTDKALDLMPPMYVRVVNSADEEEVNRLIREKRPEVIRVLAKICIAAGKKAFHED
ncbi:MAG: hypothetical protein FWE60_00625 [Oscillospiraceae bacterium]|nr:hypothetical protein [Oscillospiraceae bacterium]